MKAPFSKLAQKLIEKNPNFKIGDKVEIDGKNYTVERHALDHSYDNSLGIDDVAILISMLLLILGFIVGYIIS